VREKRRIFIKNCGDQNIMVDFGGEIDISMNFKAILLKNTIEKAEIKGLKQIIVGTCSLLIQYDFCKISARELTEIVTDIEKTAVDYHCEIQSRIIEIPILFNDRWTRECALEQNMDPDYDFILEYNNLNHEQFIKKATSTAYWVKYVGFSPGLIAFNAINKKMTVRAPQLEKPRTWTPPGALGIGHSGNCIYAGRTPGGIRVAGRTPVPIFNLHSVNIIFKNNPVLFKAGDQIKLRPIDENTFSEIQHDISNYRYQIEESLVSLQKLQGA
jgi:allophanate hydrolase subunit 1